MTASPPPLPRKGCCVLQKIPCMYHQGVEDVLRHVVELTHEDLKELNAARRTVAKGEASYAELILVSLDELAHWALSGDWP